MTSEIALKHALMAAAQRIVKSSQPDVQAFADLTAAAGDLLGHWTGERVRVLITADGHKRTVDMVKGPPP